MAEEYWVGFRPQPQRVEGELVAIELAAESSLSHGEVFSRITTPSGIALWAKEVRKADPRPGGRIELVLWDDLVAEGAFAQIALGKSVDFTLDALGLIQMRFSEGKAGTRISLKCSKIVESDDRDLFESNAKKLLTAIAKN